MMKRESSRESVLQVTGVVKRFGTKVALNAVDLEVARGASVIVAGESGSGKTTLLRLIAGLELPDAGAIMIGGRAVSSAKNGIVPNLRGVGMVFQDLGLWPNLTVEKTLRLALGRHPERPTTTDSLVEEQIRIFRLDGLTRRRVASLSGGEQQRVALARATIGKPRLLLLDEPFAGIDILLKQSLLEALHNLRCEESITILSVVHSPQDAFGLKPDSVHFLIGGQITESVTWSKFSKAQPHSGLACAWKRAHDSIFVPIDEATRGEAESCG